MFTGALPSARGVVSWVHVGAWIGGGGGVPEPGGAPLELWSGASDILGCMSRRRRVGGSVGYERVTRVWFVVLVKW